MPLRLSRNSEIDYREVRDSTQREGGNESLLHSLSDNYDLVKIMVSVVDYGLGNLGSILNMLKKIGIPSRLVSTPRAIEESEKLILPGVGAFDHGMSNLQDRGLIEELNKKALVEKIPILGICLGAQLMTRRSEEGVVEGLGWFEAETSRFQLDKSKGWKVPHMGWNGIVVTKEMSPLFQGFQEVPRFYFVHSYHMSAPDSETLAKTHYGYDFVSVLHRENLFGVQFHPEKSHKFGMKLLQNFSQI